LRIPDFSLIKHESVLVEVINFVQHNSIGLLVNCSVPEFNQIASRFSNVNIGLHVNRHNAALIEGRPVGANVLFGVSCHNKEEILHAQEIGADYLLVSPVLSTLSHPDVAPLGWEGFAELGAFANVPVYALGGLSEVQIDRARKSGAQGIAGISAWW
jgi:8-oxo-dGTP diphosphatase